MNRPDIVSQAGGILWVPGVRNKKARRLWEVLDEFGLTDLATLADRGCPRPFQDRFEGLYHGS
jgi:hypothetical protein